jgi:hypothetical protein
MYANLLNNFRRCSGEWCLSLLVPLLVLSATCRTTNNFATVERHNPEEVLRAYFDAWAHNDTERQKSFMTKNYAGLVREPVDSLRVVSVTPVDSASATTRVYAVSFEIKFNGQGVSMDSGRYNWRYTLTWDATGDSWLISNYGAG